jgi:hypothetical protein
MNSSIIARLYVMAEIAGRGVSFVGVGTLPYTDYRLNPIVSFLTTNRMICSHGIVSGCFSVRKKVLP